jgi:uncharacterized protein YydD (DUF2326 family)
MNVVLADQAKDSDETESTNGLGKTTLIRIMHFCLGSDLSKDKVLRHPDLKGVTFGIDLSFDGRVLSATRNTGSSQKVTVTAGFVAGLGFEVQATDGNNITISLEDWKTALTTRFAPGRTDTPSPSFRELSLYLMRLGKPAFADPLTAFQNQSGPSKRVTISYLLGLNWPGQRRLQNLLDSRTQVDAAIKALSNAETSASEKSIGDLEAERVALEAAIAEKRAEVESFNVREDYRQLQISLEQIDRELHELINENHSDQRLLQHYQDSAAELPEVDPEKPLSILKSAGAIFRDDVLKTLDEVAEFHTQVHRNRSAFLQGEIARLKAVIRQRRDRIDELSAKKSNILGLLKSSGALEQLIELQRSYTEQTSRFEVLKARIAERKKFDLRKEELTAEIAHERALMRRDLDDRQKTIDEARLLFAEYTKYLYGKPGGLAVDVNAAGYSFTFTIDREGSDGVDQMVVFCFDLAIATLRARRKLGFRTLVHDSALFADVDPRQYGLALRLAEEKSRLEGFQYICCLNSGALPVQHLADLDLTGFTRLRLTDEGEEGRLLGMRLPPREHGG